MVHENEQGINMHSMTEIFISLSRKQNEEMQ